MSCYAALFVFTNLENKDLTTSFGVADGAEYGGSWSGTMFTVLGRKNTLYYQYLLQIH